MEARAQEILVQQVAPFLKENYSTILKVGELVWKGVEELRECYSEEEVQIIDMAQKIYFDIFRSNDYPLHISYKAQDKSKRKFPAYQAEDKRLAFQPERLGSNEMALPLKSVIIDLVSYYNACKDKWIKGNFYAIKYVIFYLIDVAYVLSKIDLRTAEAMKEVGNHLQYVKRLMSMKLLRKNLLGNDHTDASKTLAKVVVSLSQQCLPRVVELSNRLDASLHLAALSKLIEHLCSSSFDIALHLPTSVVIPDNVNLLNIEKEKNAQYGDKEVRKYAIDPMHQKEDDRYSFRHFIYGLSTSLLSKLQSKKPSGAFRSFVSDEQGIRKNLSSHDKGFYFYSDKEFIESYMEFALSTERLAFLRQHVEEARNVYQDGGNLLYFIINGAAAREMLDQVRDAIKALSSTFAKIDSIAENKAIQNISQKKSDENKKWDASYEKVLEAGLEVEFKKKIEEMKDACHKLITLHEYFMENPERRIEEIAKEARDFRENVFAIKGNLQRQALQMRQAPESKEDIEALEESKLAEAVQPTGQQTRCFPAKLIKLSTLEILWDFHLISARRLRKSLFDLNKKFPLNVTDYTNAERNLLEMYQGNKKTKSAKQIFKDCQSLYFKLDSELAKIKTSDSDFVALIFLFRFELAHRQATHIAIILDKEMCDSTEMTGSIKRFNEKCLADIASCRGLTEEERDYKNALNNMVFYLAKMLGGDTSYFLKRKVMDDAQSFSSSAVKPYRARFFQLESLPLQLELDREEVNPLFIEDDEQDEVIEEPQKNPEPNKIIYNKNVKLELKEKDNDVVLNELAFFCYEALKASHTHATNPYNGYNFWWSYSKEDNIKRHERHQEHYQQLLQCTAYLTRGGICTEVKGSVADIAPVTEDELLRWIEDTVRDEKKYYGQYPMYNTLSKFLDKRNNDELALLKKAKADTDKKLKASEDEILKKEEVSAQQIKELIEKSAKSDEAAKKSAEDANAKEAKALAKEAEVKAKEAEVKAKEAEVKAKEAEVQAKNQTINEQNELIRNLQRQILALNPVAIEKNKLPDPNQPHHKPAFFNR
jgi:hypothetical protein